MSSFTTMSDRCLPCAAPGIAEAGAARAKGNTNASPMSQLRMKVVPWVERQWLERDSVSIVPCGAVEWTAISPVQAKDRRRARQLFTTCSHFLFLPFAGPAVRLLDSIIR